MSTQGPDRDEILRICFELNGNNDAVLQEVFEEYSPLHDELLGQLGLEFGVTVEKWPFADRKYRYLLRVVELIRTSGDGKSLNQMRELVRSQLPINNGPPGGQNIPRASDDALNTLIFAALRIWLLVNFRSGGSRSQSIGKNRPIIKWHNNETLRSVLERQFRPSTTELTLAQRRLHPEFTAANMKSVCRISLQWASTIDDHLRLDRQTRILSVFCLRKWLYAKEVAAESSVNIAQPGPSIANPSPTTISSAPLPVELYAETGRTLDLLFPAYDKKTQKLMQSEGKDFLFSHSVEDAHHRTLDLRDYPYWRDRLLELNEDIFLAPPEGLAQLWYDRRDPQKFWTFWLALSVFFLSMVSTVATIIQTVATLKS